MEGQGAGGVVSDMAFQHCWIGLWILVGICDQFSKEEGGTTVVASKCDLMGIRMIA